VRVLDIWTIAGQHPHPAAPLITWISADDGARIELSTSTALNHMAKIANACADELDIEVGTPVFVDISWHWQLPMWLGGLWAAGAHVVTDVRTAEVVITDEARAHVHSTFTPCYAVSLHPFGLDIASPLPATCMDATQIVRTQPDALMFPQNFSAARALDERDQHHVIQAAQGLVEAHSIAPAARILATATSVAADQQFLVALPLPLSCQGSLVMCERADETLIESERVTHVWT
jgi:uncharacterized protein (TIGR03089 family)